jgi:hypothetical protein
MKKLYPLALLSVFSIASNATVIYTDVMPDITNTGNSTQVIDLNNDLTTDFQVTGAQSGNLSFNIMQAGVAPSNLILSDGNGSALALSLNTLIGSGSTTWFQMNNTNLQMILVNNNVGTGTWAGANDKYLGLEFIFNSNTYYGWARITMASTSNTYTLKDYAYEDNAGQSILAGQTVTGLKAPVAGDLQVTTFPSPSKGQVTFQLGAANEQMLLSIFDVAGKPVKEILVPENTAFITLDLTTLSKGIYAYRLQGSSCAHSGRLVLGE